jgi:hypothetical protein
MGFVVIQGPDQPGRAELMALAHRLGLGAPFTPPIYRGSGHTSSDGVSALTVAGDVQPGAHPFQNRDSQALHCDGTVQQLGQIATTLMICVRPARSGGVTILFDALAAFGELAIEDPAVADQLVHPQALVRTSDLADHPFTAGPAFGYHRGRMVTRYSRQPTDTYHPRRAEDQPALDRALRFLDDAAQPGSPHRCEFSLAAGQALLLANDRVCHGRTAYQDDPMAPRMVLRALFTRHPDPTALDASR